MVIIRYTDLKSLFFVYSPIFLHFIFEFQTLKKRKKKESNGVARPVAIVTTSSMHDNRKLFFLLCIQAKGKKKKRFLLCRFNLHLSFPAPHAFSFQRGPCHLAPPFFCTTDIKLQGIIRIDKRAIISLES